MEIPDLFLGFHKMSHLNTLLTRLTRSGKRATKPPRRISTQNLTYAPRITPHTSHIAFHLYFVFHITFTFHVPYSVCMPSSYSTLVPHASLDKFFVYISYSILHIHFIHHIPCMFCIQCSIHCIFPYFIFISYSIFHSSIT
jgi:hypothetical protein